VCSALVLVGNDLNMAKPILTFFGPDKGDICQDEARGAKTEKTKLSVNLLSAAGR